VSLAAFNAVQPQAQLTTSKSMKDAFRGDQEILRRSTLLDLRGLPVQLRCNHPRHVTKKMHDSCTIPQLPSLLHLILALLLVRMSQVIGLSALEIFELAVILGQVRGFSRGAPCGRNPLSRR
jgi:hypothetical protein